MKKYFLILLMITGFLQAQTYQNPTFGTITTKTTPTVTSVNFLTTVEASGQQAKINPINLPISTATQTALDLKANIASPTFTGTVTTPNLVVNNDAIINGFTAGKGTGNVSSNTVFGYQAGLATPTYSDSNVFIGYQAGLLNTGGRENVFIGYQAGRNYTSSGDPIENGLNVFIGSLSGLNTTTGISNTFIGQKSGAHNTTGSYNAFIGVHAAHSFTSGDHNIVFGKSFDNGTASGITGDFNVIVGDGIGGVSGAKSRNSIFGYGSGGAMTASVSNSMFGYRNGVALLTGSNNTLLGYQAGYNITTGSNNINIGSNVTVANSNITTGSNNIVIGNDIQVASATASNQLNIGNIIFGTGLSGSGSTITGNIGIGTAAPNSVLEVSNPSAEVRITSSTSTNPARIRFSNGVNSFIGNEGSSGGSLVPGSSAYATVINTQGGSSIQFGTANTIKATITSAGNMGIGLTGPTAALHVKAGTSSVAGSPLKLSTGVASQTPVEQGAINWDGTNLYIGSTASPVNQQFAFLASPALTGTPTAPTAANGTNTTQLATTAFVENAINTDVSIQKIVDNADADADIDTNSNISLFSGTSDDRQVSISTANSTGSLYSNIQVNNNQIRITNEDASVYSAAIGISGGLAFTHQTTVGVGTTSIGVDAAISSTNWSTPAMSAGSYKYASQPKEYLVSTLPTPTGSDSRFAIVTDATAPTYLGTLTGGGSVVCPVFYNGSAWVSH